MSHLFICFQGGPFDSAWQSRYAKLYPNRLELHAENNKVQLIFMEDIEDIGTELVTVRKTKLLVFCWCSILIHHSMEMSILMTLLYHILILFSFHPKSPWCECRASVCVVRVHVCPSHPYINLSDKLPEASDALHRHRQTQNITHNNIR